MSRSERHHGRTRIGGAAQLLAIALVATLASAPIAQSFHELTVRHIRCAEHGEVTHVPGALATTVERVEAFSTVEDLAVDTVDAHDHCAIVVVARGRVDHAVFRSPVRFTPPPAIVRDVQDVPARPGRAFVLASAPKTSPPSA